MNMRQFLKDRDEAFSSMDKSKIISYCKKYHISIPKKEEVFWAGVHKSVCELFLLGNTSIDETQYNVSYNWLLEHGYTPSITKDDN